MSENRLPVVDLPVNIDMDSEKGNMLLKLYDAATKFNSSQPFAVPPSPPAPATPAKPKSAPTPPGVPTGSFNPVAAMKAANDATFKAAMAPFKALSPVVTNISKAFELFGKALSKTMGVLKTVFSTAIRWTLGMTALAGGSMFGYDKLARSVSASFTQSRGMNVSTGAMHAAHNVWGQISGSDQALSNVAAAQNDVMNPANRALRALRINPDDDVFSNYKQLMKSAYSFARNNEGPAAKALFNFRYGALGFGSEAHNQFRAMDEDEYRQKEKQLDRQQKGSNLSDSTQKSFQDTMIYLQGNVDKLGSGFVKMLEVINPELQKFSDAFTKNMLKFMEGNGTELFTKIADGLKTLSKYMASPEFLNDMSSLANGIAALARGVVTGLQLLGVMPGESRSNPGPMDPETGPKFAPVTDRDWSLKDFIGDFYDDPNRLQTIQKKEKLFQEAAKKYNLKSEHLKAIAKIESQGKSSAVSYVNKKATAFGLMQVTADTGKHYGYTPEQLLEARSGLDAGSHAFYDNLKQQKGNYAKALAQYNGGWRALGVSPNMQSGNLHLKKETVDYLLKAIRSGFHDIEQQNPGIKSQLEAARSYLSKSGHENERVIIQLSQTPGSDTQASISSTRSQNALYSV